MCATGECLHPVNDKGDCELRPADLLLSGTGYCTECGKGRIAIEQQLAFGELHGFGSTGNDDNDPATAEAAAEVIGRAIGSGVIGDEIRVLFSGSAVESGVEPDGPAGV